MKNDINLEEFLSRPSVDLQEMLQVPNILGDIKSSFPRFVTYLQTRKAAIFQLIDLVTTTSQEQLETDEGLKRVCFCANQILSNDDDSLMNLYFEPTEEEIPEDINEELEIERLLSNELPPIPDGEDKPAPGEVLHKLMDYLTQDKPNNDALDGYFFRIVNNIIRKKGTEFLRFMQGNPKETEGLLANLKSPSLGSLVVKMLLVDDEKKQYPFQAYKQHLVNKIYEQCLNYLGDPDASQSLCMLIEQSFQNIKNKFFEVPEDFVTAMNFLVSDTVVSSLVAKLLETNPTTIETLSALLHLLLRKMNSEVEEYNSYQKERRENKPMELSDFILKFKLDAIFDQFQSILAMLTSDAYSKATEYSRHKFTEFLVEITKSDLLFQRNFDYDVILSTLLNEFSKKQIGLLKLTILQLLRVFIAKAPQESIDRLKLSDHDFMRKYFPHFLSNNSEQRNINMDSIVGMENSIVLALANRVDGLLPKIHESLDVDMQAIKSRYSFCLGGAEAKKNNSYLSSDDSAPFSHSTKEESKAERVVVLVGKNKDIPLTNLRDLINDSKKTKGLEIKTSTIEAEKKLVIEIEEQEIRVPNQTNQDGDDDAPSTIPGVIPSTIPQTIPIPQVIPATEEPAEQVRYKDFDQTMKELSDIVRFYCPFYQLI